jgi:hypothetical protein
MRARCRDGFEHRAAGQSAGTHGPDAEDPLQRARAPKTKEAKKTVRRPTLWPPAPPMRPRLPTSRRSRLRWAWAGDTSTKKKKKTRRTRRKDSLANKKKSEKNLSRSLRRSRLHCSRGGRARSLRPSGAPQPPTESAIALRFSDSANAGPGNHSRARGVFGKRRLWQSGRIALIFSAE